MFHWLFLFIERNAKSEKPFFAYYAGKGNHFWGAHPDFMNQPAGTNNSAQMAEHDHNVGRVLDKLKELGIAENTLVVWMSDNGPMYAMHPHGGYSLLRGEKGDTWEGGVRVPAMVWWPGTVNNGQEPIDIVQVSDMFTTAASIAGVKTKFQMTASRTVLIREHSFSWVKANPGGTTSFTTTRTSSKRCERIS